MAIPLASKATLAVELDPSGGEGHRLQAALARGLRNAVDEERGL
jgi:hypothetical protein